jgi:hypothetical protein
MITAVQLSVIQLCLEGFFFGKISVLLVYALALSLTLANEVQLFLGLGIYTGIFAIYLQCPSKVDRTATIVFYVLCFLYVLSMANVAVDLLEGARGVSNNSICKIVIMLMRIDALSPQLQHSSQLMLFNINVFQTTANGSCDLIAQCVLVCLNYLAYHPFYSPKSSKIFRCWIVWGKDIRVVIIPSFLAIVYIGQ